MQLKSPATPSTPPAPPILAVNGPSSGGGAPEAGGASAFAKLMESQAGNLAKATLPVAPPPALSASPKDNPAPQRGTAGQATASNGKAAEPKSPSANGALDANKAMAQQQAERNRLNAQREARNTAARASASSPAHPAAPSAKSTDAGRAKETDEARRASAQDEERSAEDDAVSTPQALLNWIQDAAAVEARQGASSGQGQLSDEAKQALAAQEAAAGLPADAATAAGALPTGAAAGAPTALPGADAGGDPLATGAAAVHGSAKPQHHGLMPVQEAAAGASSAAQAPGGEAAGKIALRPELAGAKMDMQQQAELIAQATGGANGAGGSAGRGAGGVEGPNAGNFAAMLHQHTSAAHETAAPVSVDLPTPVQSPEFKEALGVQVSLLARDGVQSAELHLNPADMGPISVQITLDGTQARVDFGADSASTRQLIESGLPELAGALRDAGLTLSGGGVSQHAQPQQQQGRGDASGQGGEGRRAGGDGGSSDPQAAPVRSATAARRVALGGVDVYA